MTFGTDDLSDAISSALVWAGSLDSGDAQILADEVINLVITALRHEAPQRSRLEWECRLADLRQSIAELLAGAFEGVEIDPNRLAMEIIEELDQ
jgi:hypothetical protein